MSKIRIIGLGTGKIDDLTVKAYNTLFDGSPVFLRTERHPIIEDLKNNGINFISFDNLYDEFENFNEIYTRIIDEILEKSQKYGTINYCTAGSPYFGDVVTEKLLDINNDNIQIDIIDGISFLDKCIKITGFGNNESIKVLDCISIDEFSFDTNSVNIIKHVYNEKLASELKLSLSEVYSDNSWVILVNVLSGDLRKIPLYELDRQKKYDFSTFFCISTIDNTEKTVYNINDLCRILKNLRNPDGCPWDRKQTHKSLRQCVIEEAYEVVDAIDNDNVDELQEELGDLLLQVIFHSQIGSEEGYFNIHDVISGICKKLYFRHPHVFSNKKAENTEEALLRWEESKAKEKSIDTYTEMLEKVPKSFSPLLRSFKIQKKAASVGFDWPDIDGAIIKVKEEILELMTEYKNMDINKIEDEFGDLLFALVNFARFLKISPDVALNRTIDKFLTRFKYIEDNADRDLKEMTLEEMDALWEQSKTPE